ncbi:MAG: histidine kinase [Actinomycetota bacterium]|nr:histidine kinase [Actinomycetota bacterium]
MKGGIFSLRRLRWKLTLSYTLVAVVTLLAVELIAVSALVLFLYSDLFPTLVTQQVRDEFVPSLEKPLSQDPPDSEKLREELTFFANGSDVQGTDVPSPEEPGVNFRLTPDEGALFVVDENGRLLVSVPELRSYEEGEPFEAERVPGLAPLVETALEGEERAKELSMNTPEGRVLTAIPVEDEKGRVVGALVGTFRMPNLTGPLLIAVGVSAVLLTIPAAFLGTIFGFFTAWGLTRRLRRLARAARSWSRGDFSVVTKDRSKDELGQLSRELNDMAVQLESLLQARGELATLEARNRFARDLHDSVKQQVFATSLQIAAARTLIQRDTDSAEAHLSQADELVRQAQRELNVLIAEMRPAALEGKGLAGALREYMARWSQGAEIPADLHVQGERETPLEVEQALFRVAQEALANVARHSGAGRVDVDLIYTSGTVTLRVTDDGQGFDPTQGPGGGFGLQSMRERLVRLGGHVDVESERGRGTRVTCVCPLDDKRGKDL